MNLVIGATGIVGSHVLLELLQNNENVVATKQKNSDISKVKELFDYYGNQAASYFDKIKWIDVDIQDVFSIEENLDQHSTVYHCAGLVSFDNKDRTKLKQLNELGTKNVVDACLFKKVKALCFVSSIATINNSDYTLPLSEDVFWKKKGNESDYAWSKYNAEREVWRGMQEGLNAVIVNPGIILSPVFWSQSSAKLFDVCFKGNKFYTNGLAAYVMAPDVAKTMLGLMHQQQYGNRFILAENDHSFKEILGKIQQAFGKPAPSIQISAFALRLAQILEFFMVIFTRKERKLSRTVLTSAHNTQRYSNKKVKACLGYEFKPIHTGIEEICRYYSLQKSQRRATL
jgi:nucleoside-diphosphate-sugar epimerase